MEREAGLEPLDYLWVISTHSAVIRPAQTTCRHAHTGRLYLLSVTYPPISGTAWTSRATRTQRSQRRPSKDVKSKTSCVFTFCERVGILLCMQFKNRYSLVYCLSYISISLNTHESLLYRMSNCLCGVSWSPTTSTAARSKISTSGQRESENRKVF